MTTGDEMRGIEGSMARWRRGVEGDSRQPRKANVLTLTNRPLAGNHPLDRLHQFGKVKRLLKKVPLDFALRRALRGRFRQTNVADDDEGDLLQFFCGRSVQQLGVKH